MNKNKKVLAEFVSNIFNPGVLANLILLVAVYQSNMPKNIAIAWYVSIVVLNGLLPGLFYMFFTNKGYVFDDTLSNKKVHKQRSVLFGLFLAITAIELLIMVSSNNYYQPLYAVLIGGIISIIFAGAVSYFWKVSLHSSIVTMFVMMILYIFGFSAWPVVLIIPLVWWSRLILSRHTIWQLLGGFTFSIIIVYLVFIYFKLV